ncbi:MAG: lipocalin family protein [Flammeovirgaceae bacterium]
MKKLIPNSILYLCCLGLLTTLLFTSCDDDNGGEPNNAPVIVNPIEDQDLDEGFGTKTIDISNIFTDLDEDLLTFEVSTSDTSIVSVNLSGNILTIQEGELGTAMITLSANDGEDSVSDEFTITVSPVTLNGTWRLVSATNDGNALINPTMTVVFAGNDFDGSGTFSISNMSSEVFAYNGATSGSYTISGTSAITFTTGTESNTAAIYSSPLSGETHLVTAFNVNLAQHNQTSEALLIYTFEFVD